MVQGGNPTRDMKAKKKKGNPIVRKLTKCWSRKEFMDGHESDECSPMKSIGNKKIDNKLRSSYGKEIIKKLIKFNF